MTGAIPPAIRPARPDDETFLLDLMTRLADFPVPAWRRAADIAAADRGILLDALHAPRPDAAILVAEVAGERRGYAFVTTRTDYFTGELHGHVEVVAVERESAGRGLGRTLLTAAESWARGRGYRAITLNVWDQNEAAKAVYRRLDYRPETVHYWKSLEGGAR